MFKRGTIMIGLTAIICIAFLFWPGLDKHQVSIDVSSGMNAHQVLNQMIQKDLLTSPYPFLFWTKVRGAGSKLKLGRYQFSAGRSAYWIVDDLVKGKTKKIKVIIPEGFASWQIGERLEEREICNADAFTDYVKGKDLEGFLLPATYEFDFGLNPHVVANQMKREFDSRWNSRMALRAKSLGWTQKEVVTLASIIEREVMERKELPLVSALYNNRLRKNMKLEADPTVQFSMGFWKSRLLYSDYKNTKSPYNTYLHKGLPPGPICSPGFDAIEAALWPGKSTALYMVAKEDGLHDFSETYREHVNKVNRRNRLRRKKR